MDYKKLGELLQPHLDTLAKSIKNEILDELSSEVEKLNQETDGDDIDKGRLMAVQEILGIINNKRK